MGNPINYGTKSADAAYPIVDASKQWTFEDANEVKTKHNLNDTRITNLEKFKYGYIALGNIGGQTVGYSDYVVDGDISSVQKTGGNTTIDELTVTLATAMTNTTYFVRVFVESYSSTFNSGADNEVKVISFYKISTTQFKLMVEEIISSTQDIKLHVEVIQK